MSDFDLHCHSNCSDGELPVGELINLACEKGVRVLALTDHDTVQGVDAALDCAQGRLTVVPGIEVSITWYGLQIHIVGLFVDHHSTILQDLVSRQLEKRTERAKAIGRKLERLGFADAYQRTVEMSGENAIITRGNYARYLYSIKAASSVDDAFNAFLKKGKKGYVKTQWIGLEECISTIHASGGYAVIAHPKRYKITSMVLRRLITEFKELGGDAMEVSMSCQGDAERDYLAGLCRRFELCASAGSDFHRLNSRRVLGQGLDLPGDLTPVWTLPAAQDYLSRAASA